MLTLRRFEVLNLVFGSSNHSFKTCYNPSHIKKINIYSYTLPRIGLKSF